MFQQFKIVDKISITHPILKSDEKSTKRVFCRNIKNSGFTKDQLNCTLLFTKEPSPISQPLPWDPSIPFHVKLLIKTFAIFKAKRENNNLQIFHIVDSHFPPPLSHSKTKKSRIFSISQHFPGSSACDQGNQGAVTAPGSCIHHFYQ